jgi:5-methylcytosine-specific restriction endonuclease McrA
VRERAQAMLAIEDIMANLSPEDQRFVAREVWRSYGTPGWRPWKRKAISQWLRRFILERDGHQCRRCGATEKLHIDHIRPVARGGDNAVGNLQCLCRSCNLRKHTTWLPA